MNTECLWCIIAAVEWANMAIQTKQLSYTRFRTRMTQRFLQFLNNYIYHI